MKKALAVSILVLVVMSGSVIYFAGCSNKFWDPSQIGRFRPVPAVNVILDSLGVVDEELSPYENAEEPRPADILPYDLDYVFGPGDIVRVSVFELLQEGVPYVNDYVITETGNISLPPVGIVEAVGLTENQLEEAVKQMLSPDILVDPSVSVTLLSSQQRTFTIYGDGIPRSSRYEIPRYDFRLADAIATAGGISQFNTSYIYVTRIIKDNETVSPAEPEQMKIPDDTLDIVAPRVQRPASGFIITTSEMVTDEELAAAAPEGFDVEQEAELSPAMPQVDMQKPAELSSEGQTEWVLEDGKWIQKRAGEEKAEQLKPQPQILESIAQPIQPEQGRIEWVFRDGKWLPMRVGEHQGPQVVRAEAKSASQAVRQPSSQMGWEEIGSGGVQTRLIEIDADKLRSGDPRYNIVIRSGDTILVPSDVIGEYFIFGNVNAQGAVPMTGRPLTLKMAIATAGGLGPLAFPKKCEVTRRIARDKEVTVMVDLDKIASGEQPDFFIKPFDLINVGTHPTSMWRAVLRNSFRATYGFGFIYDRNFADRDFGTGRPFNFF
ncbi:MAG: polysaccharide biosynthesis/export family protein [Phycisphaerae bacterium]|nr:polysaccharide biosynthesis/export family protein [Phycisphaerae bacterium]